MVFSTAKYGRDTMNRKTASTSSFSVIDVLFATVDVIVLHREQLFWVVFEIRDSRPGAYVLLQLLLIAVYRK